MKHSVYIPDGLWLTVRRGLPDGSASRLVQQGLELLLREHGIEPFDHAAEQARRAVAKAEESLIRARDHLAKVEES